MNRRNALTIVFAAALFAPAAVSASPVSSFLPALAHVEALAEQPSVRIPDVRALTVEPVAAKDMKGASSGFGWRDDPIRHVRKFHAGDDYRGNRGVPVMAAGSGVVILAKRQGGYGNVVYIDHGDGLVTRYGHLQRIGVQKGETVTAGQPIGKLGSTGRTTGPHLHFEVRFEGSPVDPSKAFEVAALQRTSPEQGRIAALALTPEASARAESKFDPPKRRKSEAKRDRDDKTSRPDRRGTVKRVRPVS